jgi:hypothetical protein
MVTQPLDPLDQRAELFDRRQFLGPELRTDIGGGQV